ncbi:MAG: hypothetical protein Q8L52_02385, partial [bacterium]|nr:hypothetical protein [bacterium]
NLGKETQTDTVNLHEIFENLVKEKSLTFSRIKDKMIKEQVLDAENFLNYKDIPNNVLIDWIPRVKKYQAKFNE